MGKENINKQKRKFLSLLCKNPSNWSLFVTDAYHGKKEYLTYHKKSCAFFPRSIYKQKNMKLIT